MKRKLKSVLSLLLCMIMVVSILPFSTFAENNSELNPDMAYYTDSGMGKIVNNLSKETKANESENYYILDTQVSESKVTVLYSAVEDCKVLVAAFDEDSGKMLGSGNSDALSVDREATVTLDCTLPSEYIIKAYLVGEDLSALSAEYIDLHHTAAFKEFLEKTPADYSEDKVVILDDDQSDFGVLDGSVIDCKTSEAMTYTYSEATMTYVFKNATSEVKALTIGDVFYYEYGEKTNEFILFKVKSIDVSGSTVTIVEDENISLGDAFKFIRIDEKADFSQVDIDENELGEALSPAPDPQLAPSRRGAIDKNEKATFSKTYNLQCKINDNASITGSLGLSLSIEARLYYDVKLLGKDYCEFKTEINATAEYKVSVTGSIAIDKEKSRLPIPEIPLGPFSLKISLYPVASFSGSASFSASLKLKYTVTYDSETSELKKGAWSDVTPKAEISEKAEIKIGLGLEFNLSLLKVFNVSLAGDGGAKATLLMNTGLSLWLEKHHDCVTCVDGAVNFFVNIKLSAGIKIIPKILEFKADAVNWTYEKYLFDFYVSLSSDGFKCGKGECPNVEYSVIFTITGRDGKPVEGATVRSDTGRCDADGDQKYDDKAVKTDKGGKATFYFRKGSHSVTAAKDGNTKTENFKIIANAKKITINLGGNGSAVGDIITFGSYPQSEVTKKNDSATYAKLEAASKNWVSYRYYSGDGDWAEEEPDVAYGYGTMKQGDWMKYADITLDGEKYRAVRFTAYRPDFTGDLASTTNGSYSMQDDNGYKLNTVYYFKYEPLKWRVLDPKKGLVLSENIIDSQAYSNTICTSIDANGHLTYWNNASYTEYANDYATSSIRKWLNEDFYNTAFTSAQKQNILPTTLDNKAYSTDYSKYDSVSTTDNIFLLSHSEAKSIDEDTRWREGTDYAKVQGFDGESWHLRSAGNFSHETIFVFGGMLYTMGSGDLQTGTVGHTGYGIRPALRLSNLATNTGDSSSAKAHSPAKAPFAASFSPNKTNKVYKYYANTVPGRVYMLYAFSGERELSKLESVTYKVADSDSTIFEYIPRNKGELKMMLVYKDGDKVKQSKAVLAENVEFKIREPSTKTLNYGQTLVLTTESKNMPQGSYTEWVIPNKLAVIKNDWIPITADKTCEELVIAIASTADDETIVNAEGDHAIDYITIECKSNFFLKLIAFFKKLFGISMVLPYLLEGIIK